MSAIEKCEPPTVEALIEGMAVAFSVENDDSSVTTRAFVDGYTYRNLDETGNEYPRRIECVEYHSGSEGEATRTRWKFDPLSHRVWCKAPCDDEFERAGSLVGFELSP